MTSHTRFPTLPAGVAEFEETRPALYYAADRWGHLPDGRQRDRRASNDAQRPVAVVRDDSATAPTPGLRAERRAGWKPLGLLSVMAVVTVALLGVVSATLEAEHAPDRSGARVASASH